jgi:hypothetical protein
MASEIKVDTISEKTSANGVTIDGVSLKDSKVATANSIDSDTYVDGSIDAVHMSANSIDSDSYVDGSIDTVHIADNQVTLAKMAGLVRGKIIYGDSSGDPAALTVGSNGQALVSDGTDISWGSAGASLSNDGNNRIVTGDGSGGLNGEANLSFDGSTLAVTGAATVSGATTLSDDLTIIDDKGIIFGTGGDWFLGGDDGEAHLTLYAGSTQGRGTNEGMVEFLVGDGDCQVKIMGGENDAAVLYMYGDQGDDNNDNFQVYANNNAWKIASGSDGVWDFEFQVEDDGIVAEHDITIATVSDYAEFFEWKTELANDARITETYGLTVVLDGDKVRLAEAGEEADVLGVVRPSKTPAIVGGDGTYWLQRRIKNVWGEEQKEAYIQVNWHNLNEHGRSIKHYSFMQDRIPQYELIDQPKQDIPNWHLLDANFKRDGDGNKIVLVVPSTDEEKVAHRYTERTTHKKTGQPLMRRIINPAYDPSLTFIRRIDRRTEWCLVGLLGQVPVRDTAIVPTHWKLMKNLESGINMYYIK